MSELVIDDWKLKARTVVKLHRKNTNTLVSLLVKDDIINCLNVLFNRASAYGTPLDGATVKVVITTVNKT